MRDLDSLGETGEESSPVDSKPLDADNPAVASEQRARRRSERNANRQKILTRLLEDSTIDWQAVRGYCDMDGLDPNVTDFSTNITTAHLAAYAGESDILRWCIRKGADVNARSSVGRSVLHHACDGNQVRCLQMLLEHGADANVRTLGMLTPLHIACRSNSYDAVNALLNSQQVIDIDAEGPMRQIPEAMSKDKRVLRAIRKYRNKFDERRKADLMEDCLKRIFVLFDKDSNGAIFPEEWVESQSLLAQHFVEHSGDRIDEAFEQCDVNHDGKIDWQEFKSQHVEMLAAVGVPFRDLMHSLCDIENAIFQQKVMIANGEGSCKSPVISKAAKGKAFQRTLNLQNQVLAGSQKRSQSPPGSRIVSKTSSVTSLPKLVA